MIEDAGGTQAAFVTRMFKHQERELKKDDATPVEEIREKSKAQITRMKHYLDEVKGGLSQQIEGNKKKRIDEKEADKELGKIMVEKAFESIADEERFVKIKKERATDILRKQWAEQIKLKSNEQLVDKIFM